MKIIKWEIIKLNAVREFFGRAGGNKSTIGVGSEQEQAYLLALVAAIHMERPQNPVEIAKVRKLIELFPSWVPKSCHKQPITCDNDEAGDWVVCFGLPV